MAERLLSWIDRPLESKGIHLLRDDGSWERTSYAQLARETQLVAGSLADMGVASGDRVCLSAETGKPFIQSFFATQLLGATAVPLPTPTVLQTRQYVEYTCRLVRAARPALALGPSTFKRTLETHLVDGSTSVSVSTFPEPLGHPAALPSKRSRADNPALLQFTSGSTRDPRAVKVSRANLEANIRMITDWLDIQPHDRTATWLPLFHDMGLIGNLLAPLANQTDVFLMRPEQFVLDPLNWIRCFSRQGCTLTATPIFGLRLVLRRLAGHCLEGDLRRWRVLIVGAERIDPETLGRFADAARPAGFSPSAFMPAYGLAEATLAVTGTRLSEFPRILDIDWPRLTVGDVVPILNVSYCNQPEKLSKNGSWLVSCGRPHPGMSLQIRDEDGRALGAGRLGEIWIRGDSVSPGYFSRRSTGVFTSQGMRTGDLGFVRNGELYVVGRLADRIKLYGKALYAEDAEARLALRVGLRPSSLLLIPSLHRHDGVTILWERRSDDVPVAEVIDRLKHAVTSVVGRSICLQFFQVDRGSIPRTTSGKAQRQKAWRLLAHSEISSRLLYSSHSDNASDSKSSVPITIMQG